MADNNELNKKEIGLTSDAQVKVEINKDPLKELEEKEKFSVEEEIPKINPLGDDKYHDSYIDYQGTEHVSKKLDRPIQVDDNVILLKNCPDFHLYQGSLCVVVEITGSSTIPDEQLYLISFESDFSKNDKSRKSKELFNDFMFPSTTSEVHVKRNDIVRLETQDLRFQTYFGY